MDSKKILKEIEAYFENIRKNEKDEDHMVFDGHLLSSVENLMDPTKPAPWDHLTNTEDDEDVDIDIQESIKQ